MEKNQNRVFAYTLAKTIDHKELADVSGGGGLNMTGHSTVTASAGSGLTWDTSWDVTVDW
ncbi:MAG: hypothetical protein A3F46_02950 [Legionellales bacterium RIFCSPHIGHO2_12_FULL_42_9]|nr:MAG: hypothetical protein A3F46_02950 [Legionellales bacterium RIFCSPHIGHO2_12_FULL_42_9]